MAFDAATDNGRFRQLVDECSAVVLVQNTSETLLDEWAMPVDTHNSNAGVQPGSSAEPTIRTLQYQSDNVAGTRSRAHDHQSTHSRYSQQASSDPQAKATRSLPSHANGSSVQAPTSGHGLETHQTAEIEERSRTSSTKAPVSVSQAMQQGGSLNAPAVISAEAKDSIARLCHRDKNNGQHPGTRSAHGPRSSSRHQRNHSFPEERARSRGGQFAGRSRRIPTDRRSQNSARHASPLLPLDATVPFHTAVKPLLLRNLWEWFRDSSLFGLEVPTHNAPLGPSRAYFVPLLSAMKLFLPMPPASSHGHRPHEGPSSEGCSPKSPAHQHKHRYRCKMPGFPEEMRLLGQYQSPNLPWDRRPLYHEVQILSQSSPTDSLPEPGALMSTPLLHLHPASWIAIWWQPTYRIPDQPLDAKFLVYYSFSSIFHRLHEPELHTPELSMDMSGMMCAAAAGERWFEGGPAARDSGDSKGGRARDRVPEDSLFKAQVSELQATAKRIALGLDVELVADDGTVKDEAAHGDFTFMCKQRLSA